MEGEKIVNALNDMRHACGAQRRHKAPYRNQYVGASDGMDLAVSLGWATRRTAAKGLGIADPIYRVTAAGLAALGMSVKEIDRYQKEGLL